MSDTSSPAFLELKHVTKSYQTGDDTLDILKGIDLQLHAGETVAITGPSGSGKSTMLNIMAGLDRITDGALLLRGQAMHQWSEDQLSQWRREEVGFIFQDFRLVESFSALENVSLPLEILGWTASKAQERANSLLTDLGLGQRTHHYPRQLSGGERQRVAIARAFAHEPKLIFADEPTGNLDPETSTQVMDSLLRINEEQHTTMVLVTHDAENAVLMQRQVALVLGQVVESASAQTQEEVA